MSTLVIVAGTDTDFGFLPESLNVMRETSRSAAVECSQSDWEKLKPLLEAHACDAALFNVRPKLADFKLVAMDMDATTICNETLDEMADLAGVGQEVKAVTERAMRGEIGRAHV